MLPNWSGVSMAAFSLPQYQRKTQRSHFILLHWTFCFAHLTSFWFSPLFFLSLLPGCPPEALHYPSTWPHVHARCPLPYFPHSSTFPCKSSSAGPYLPYASRHFCQHNFWKFCWCFHLVTQLISSPHEFPGHISEHEGKRNDCCKAQGSVCLVGPLLSSFNNLSIGHWPW